MLYLCDIILFGIAGLLQTGINGSITLDFTPYPKNPIISRFFKKVGRVNELGSGIRNAFKYCSIYTPGTYPEFIEGDIFKTIIPLKAEKIISTSDWKEVNKWLGDREWQILETVWSNPTFSITEMAKYYKISTTAVEKNIKRLKEKGVLERVGSTEKGYWKIAGIDRKQKVRISSMISRHC